MEILLIRHTTPDVSAGTCYGQSDLDVAETFDAEAQAIRRRLPEGCMRAGTNMVERAEVEEEQEKSNSSLHSQGELEHIVLNGQGRAQEGRWRVVSSPLHRCRKLAAALFPGVHIEFVEALKEIDCGEWEMKKWNEIPEAESRAWAADFVHRQFPGGENYLQLSARVVVEFERIVARGEDTVIVAHGGVIRSVLAHVTCRPLAQSFDTFTLPMGCVYRLRTTKTGFVVDEL